MKSTYAESGVDRELREKAKKHLAGLQQTHELSKHGPVVQTPFNTLYPTSNGKYQVKTSDGVGTKVLISELAEKHDTIGIDAVAMVANDCIRCGAEPLAITDAIDVKKSEPWLINELQKGLKEGAVQANCPLIGGETADVPELLNTMYHINCDCVGEVEGRIIDGKKIKPDDVVIGLPSAGLHSNGISLARKVLFKKWGGNYDASFQPDGFDRELALEALQPTKIYVKPVIKAMKEFELLGAVHVTGDAFLKFLKLGIGFEFDNFHPQPIFGLIQKTGKVSDEEMFKTFNMGWGFALIAKKGSSDALLGFMEKHGVKAEVIGKALGKNKIVIKHKTKEMVL
jgi:phosphoribosylformylglycinamidine cyclo-ligase